MIIWVRAAQKQRSSLCLHPFNSQLYYIYIKYEYYIYIKLYLIPFYKKERLRGVEFLGHTTRKTDKNPNQLQDQWALETITRQLKSPCLHGVREKQLCSFYLSTKPLLLEEQSSSVRRKGKLTVLCVNLLPLSGGAGQGDLLTWSWALLTIR